MDTNLTNVWENVLTELKSTVSQGNFVTILKPTLLLSLEDDIATIAAGSPIILNLLQKRFATQIKEALKKQLGKEIDILFIVKNLPTQQKKQTAATPLFEQPESIQKELKPFVGHLPRVRPDFTFPNFAVASTNQLAFVSAQTVADNIGQSYNPLFIYGPVGVGKTHLMHAIANAVYQRDPEKKIIY